nr:translation initiation factor IF-2-like [Saimiri boliviensis boliviensis]
MDREQGQPIVYYAGPAGSSFLWFPQHSRPHATPSLGPRSVLPFAPSPGAAGPPDAGVSLRGSSARGPRPAQVEGNRSVAAAGPGQAGPDGGKGREPEPKAARRTPAPSPPRRPPGYQPSHPVRDAATSWPLGVGKQGPSAAQESAHGGARGVPHSKDTRAWTPPGGRPPRTPCPAPAALPSPAPVFQGRRAARPAPDAPGVPGDAPAWPWRDDGGAAAPPLAHRHHHRQLLRGELLHQQQQLRLRPGVPPHPTGPPHRGRDRECRRAGGGGGSAGPRRVLPPCFSEWSLLRSSRGLQGTVFAQPRLLPKVQNSDSPLQTRSKKLGLCWEERVVILRMSCWGRNSACCALSVAAADSGSRMLGLVAVEFVLSVRDTWCLSHLISTWMASSLKIKVS